MKKWRQFNACYKIINATGLSNLCSAKFVSLLFNAAELFKISASFLGPLPMVVYAGVNDETFPLLHSSTKVPRSQPKKGRHFVFAYNEAANWAAVSASCEYVKCGASTKACPLQIASP